MEYKQDSDNKLRQLLNSLLKDYKTQMQNSFFLEIPSARAQTRILLNKTATYLSHKWGFLFFHVLIIFSIFAFMKGLNYIILNKSEMRNTEIFKPRPLDGFRRCDTPGCLNLGVIVYSDKPDEEIRPWIQTALLRIKIKLNFSDEDIKLVYKGNNFDKMTEVVESHQRLQNTLYFCDRGIFVKNSTVTVDCNKFNVAQLFEINLHMFMLGYNQTRITANFLRDFNTPLEVDENSILLKKIIDESIIVYNRNAPKKIPKEMPKCEVEEQVIPTCNAISIPTESDFDYKLDLISFPKPPALFLDKFDTASQYGSLFYVFCILISFSKFLKMISDEKDRKLRKGLIPFGLSHLAYYASWLIFAFVFYLAFTLLLAFTGYVLGVVTFQNAPLPITITVLFSSMFCYALLAFFINAATSNAKSASKIGYTIIVLSLFLQMFFAENTIGNLFFLSKRPFILNLVSFLLSLLPSFPLTIILNNIHFNAGYHLNVNTFSFEKGDGYFYKTFLQGIRRKIPGVGEINRPSDLYFLVWIFGLMIFYLVLVWIFDHTEESNRGSSSNPFSSLLFWRKKSLRDYSALSDQTLIEELGAESISGYARPLMATSEQQNSHFSISNVSKRFSSSGRTIDALKNVSLSLKKNEIVALLGENGAGKSTLISIITGILSPSEGTVLRNGQPYGLELKDRLYVSVCPQYDLLWDELTVYENMRIIGQFRGMSDLEIETQSIEILTKFGLLDRRYSLVENLSGGMKRRVSIGLALLGNSELLIFDEPTTGLDPVNRKIVWNFIADLKNKGKTVLLTTHIMDEADNIADNITVINHGEILTSKTSVEIKEEFERINLIFSLKNFDESFSNGLIRYFEHKCGNTYSIMYASEKLIKITVPSSDYELIRNLVNDFENLPNSEEVKAFEPYIDSFEVASLDLEEAYILLNQRHAHNILVR